MKKNQVNLANIFNIFIFDIVYAVEDSLPWLLLHIYGSNMEENIKLGIAYFIGVVLIIISVVIGWKSKK